MATGSKKSVTQSTSIPEFAQSEIEQVLQSGLGDFSIRQLLGLLISSAGMAERKLYLEKTDDRPNGFYDRQLEVGATPVEVRVPRTRAVSFARRPFRLATSVGTARKHDRF